MPDELIIKPLGFSLVHQDTEPAISGDLLEKLRAEAVAAGLLAENAANRYRMRLELIRGSRTGNDGKREDT
jgi:hypothetical protein